MIFLAVGLVSLQRLLELALSRRNERRLRVRGAVERGRGHYPLIVALHALWLLSTLIDVGRLIVKLAWDGVREADGSVAFPLVTERPPPSSEGCGPSASSGHASSTRRSGPKRGSGTSP